MSEIKIGNKVAVHYKGTLDDGTVFDDSYVRGQPLTFEVGAGQMIRGFDAALPGMTVGETKKITVSPSDGYGDIDPNAIQAVPKTAFSPDQTLTEGDVVQGQNPNGGVVRAVIREVSDSEVVLDFNHPMAGKNMNFEIEVVEVS